MHAASAPVRWHPRRSKPDASPTPHARFDPADFQPALETHLLILQATPFCNIDCDYCCVMSRAAAPGRPKQGPTLAEGRSPYSASGVSS